MLHWGHGFRYHRPFSLGIGSQVSWASSLGIGSRAFIVCLRVLEHMLPSDRVLPSHLHGWWVWWLRRSTEEKGGFQSWTLSLIPVTPKQERVRETQCLLFISFKAEKGVPANQTHMHEATGTSPFAVLGNEKVTSKAAALLPGTPNASRRPSSYLGLACWLGEACLGQVPCLWHGKAAPRFPESPVSLRKLKVSSLSNISVPSYKFMYNSTPRIRRGRAPPTVTDHP